MNEVSINMKKQVDRAFGLDVCRTLAIFLVMSGHTLQHSRPYELLAKMGMVGIFGVDLFFCLSGFLIGRILLAESTEWPMDHETGLFQFWYRRWMRTLPLYFFWLFVSLKYDWRGETTLSAQLPYLLFAQNLAWPMTEFYNLSWSLAVEEWFYLAFPLVLLFAIGLGANARRSAAIAIVIFAVFPFLFRAYLPAHMPELKNFDEGLRHVVVFRLDGIGFGVLMAYFHMWKRAWFDRLAGYWWMFAMIVGSCVAYTKMGYPGLTGSPLLAPVYFTVLAIGCSLLIPKFNSMRPTRFDVFNRFIKFTSLVSYSLYLGHIPGFMISMWFLHRLGLFQTVYPNPWLIYPLFWGMAYFIATATYLVIERPFLKLRDKKSQGAFHPKTT